MSPNKLPEVVRMGLSNQICVPESWTDGEAERFADESCPSGTSGGWGVSDRHERAPCDEKEGFVHIIVTPLVDLSQF